MTSTGNAFAVPTNVQAFVQPPTTYLVTYVGGATDGVTSVCILGCFQYDSTQPVSTAIMAFKASVAAVALEQFGLTIPLANILVSFGVN